MTEHKRVISIWFFIGVLLLVYGVLIVSAGVYEVFEPPARTIVLAELHAAVWWGALLIALGTFYSVKFRPGRE